MSRIFLELVLLAILISTGILAIGNLISHGAGFIPQRFNSIYECGFPAMGGGRRPAPLLFFLVAILFLLFDLELLALMPAALSSVGPLARILLLGFFAVLTLGFWVEWRQGVFS